MKNQVMGAMQGKQAPQGFHGIVKRYSFVLVTAVVLVVVLLVDGDVGAKALDTTMYSFKEMLLIIPPIFVLLGLLDVWVPRQTMVKYMGEGSGLKGAVLAILLGSAAAGPLYAAFPVAAVFMKKGAKFSNILMFLGAWSTTKVPLVAFETASLGPLFAFTRLGLSIIGISLIALVMNKVMKKDEIEAIYENAKKL